MQYRPYGKLGFDVSLFSLGCMRFPTAVQSDGSRLLDQQAINQLVRTAIDGGVNYLDSAQAYTGSEEAVGIALQGGYREKVKIATKIRPPLVQTEDDLKRLYDEQCEKLQTDFIDVYLIHGLNTGSWQMVQERKILPMYERLLADGKIGAIAFSFHDDFDCFQTVVNGYDNWAMCQVQMNILDVDFQATVKGMEFAASKGLAVMLMEPLRGGGLASVPAQVQSIYDQYPEKRSAVEWAFRFLYDMPFVSGILSGINSMEQLQDNLRIFADAQPNVLSDDDKKLIAHVREVYQHLTAVPCTACGYCMPCPSGVNIPGIFSLVNNGVRYGGDYTMPRSSYNRMKGSGSADLCVECGACESQCPQSIQIIQELKKAQELLG